MNDGQRFGQNLYFSYLDKKSIATVPVDEWHGEIVQYHYVRDVDRFSFAESLTHLNLLKTTNFECIEKFSGQSEFLWRRIIFQNCRFVL